MTTLESTEHRTRRHEANIIDTLQSLIVAFVLAMTFRGFVTEGFVIPTGSMAPTLMGQHILFDSKQTSVTFAVDAGKMLDDLRNSSDKSTVLATPRTIRDPILGPSFMIENTSTGKLLERVRMGDRILVLKNLYPFSEPQRFDVVVFKNPTDPTGESQNYIKRLVGLPNEQVWLVDGDVFAKKHGAEEFVIQRKPEHVQRAVWQPVYDSDAMPVSEEQLTSRYDGPPWGGDAAVWTLRGTRSYRCSTEQSTWLSWDNHIRTINDWTPYDMLFSATAFDVSDVRVSAGIVADQPGLSTKLELTTRNYIFEYMLADGHAKVRMHPLDNPDDCSEEDASFEMPPPGEATDVEFWHADQCMTIFVNRRKIVELRYDWKPMERLQNAMNEPGLESVNDLLARKATPPELRWLFSGSPLTMHRVRVDRDLHYRRDLMDQSTRANQKNEPHISGPAFGTNPKTNAADLGPDHFMMLGDNSQASLDSRLWGSPHPITAVQIDDAPFVVHRKLLLGKAWVVYFPAPFRMSETGRSFIPDFGRLRFIR